MTHFDYITKHMLPGWVESWTYNFKIWADLMTGNYAPYANPWGESPERECYEWFWSSINLDDIYSKEFVEDIVQRMKDVKSGKVKTIPYDKILEEWSEDVQKYYEEK